MYTYTVFKGNRTGLFKLSISDDPKLFNNFEIRSLKRMASDDFVHIDCNCLYRAGIWVLETKMNVKQQITNVYESSNECVQISFFLEGISSLYFNDVTKISTEFSPGFVQLVYQCESRACFDYAAKQQVRCISIFMTKCYFLNLLEDEKWKDTDEFYIKVKQGGGNIIQNAQLISPPMRIALEGLFEQRFEGTFNNDYFQMKLREILLLYCIQQRLVARYPVTMSEEVYTKLEKAKAYLSTNLSNYPTIKQLSRMVILNEMILKQGFKLLYGQTIYTYVFNERMKEAKRLLTNGSTNVNSVAEQVGYHSIPHFITVYKKHYGITPKHTLQLMNNN